MAKPFPLSQRQAQEKAGLNPFELKPTVERSLKEIALRRRARPSSDEGAQRQPVAWGQTNPEGIVFPPPSIHPPPIKMRYRSNAEAVLSSTGSALEIRIELVPRAAPPQKKPALGMRPQGGSASWGSKARPPARLISLSSTPRLTKAKNTETQKQSSQRVTPLLAQRITLSGNSDFGRTGQALIGEANAPLPDCPSFSHDAQKPEPQGQPRRWGRRSPHPRG